MCMSSISEMPWEPNEGGKCISDKERPRGGKALSNVKLERFEFPTYGATSRASSNPSSGLLADQDVDAVLTETGDTFRARITLL